MNLVTENQTDDNPLNHPDFIRWLKAHRAALIQQAKGLEEQRRAVLAEVGELEKVLDCKKPIETEDAP